MFVPTLPSSGNISPSDRAGTISSGTHAELAFARALSSGELLAEPVIPSDWERIADLVAKYEDLPLGIVHASVIRLAERLGAGAIATLDHRHFAAVKPAHIEAFELVP